MLIEWDRDRIRTARISNARRDPLAARQAVERALSTVDMRPSGLPRGAILCVRHLRTRQPPRDDREWGNHIRHQMADLYAEAARPFAGPVPASARAVLFNDQAELLACLVRDWHRGDGSAWWWRSLVGDVTQDVVERALVESGRVVPAAIEAMEELGVAIETLSALTPTTCLELADAIADSFGVRSWTPFVEREFNPFAVEDSGFEYEVVSVARAVAAVLRASPTATALEGTSPPQRALFALATVVRRAPALATTAALARVLHTDAWTTYVRTAPVDREVASVIAVEQRSKIRAGVALPLSERESASGADVVEAPRAERNETQSPSNADALASASTSRAGEPEKIQWVDERIPTIPDARREPATRARGALSTKVDTGFAGIAYIINLALALEIYSDFTQPLQHGLELPLGDFLALILLRAGGAGVRDDPVWPVLATLAGRCDDDEPVAPDYLDDLIAGMEAAAARTLGIENPIAFLCAHHGRIALTPTRLDFEFSLAAHPLVIRLAGLDRNPGWIPAAGRIVELHYE